MSMTEAEVRAYLRSTIPDTSPKIGRIERFANEYSRGVKKGISFGVAPGSLDNTLDVDPGNMDYTDIAVFAGEMIGSLPAALLTGFGATAVAKTLGVKAARTAVAAELAGDLAQATRMRKVAQVGQYLSARAADEAPMFARAIRSGVQAGYQSIPFTAAAVTARGLDGTIESSRDVAAEFGIGFAANVLLGGLLHYPTARLDAVIGKLKNSGETIDHALADELTRRANVPDAELPPLELNRGPVRAPEVEPARTGPLAIEEPGFSATGQPVVPNQAGVASSRARRLMPEAEQIAAEQQYQARLAALGGETVPEPGIVTSTAPEPQPGTIVPPEGVVAGSTGRPGIGLEGERVRIPYSNVPEQRVAEGPTVDRTEPLSQAKAAYDRSLRLSAEQRFMEEEALRRRALALQGEEVQPQPVYGPRGEVLSAPPVSRAAPLIAPEPPPAAPPPERPPLKVESGGKGKRAKAVVKAAEPAPPETPAEPEIAPEAPAAAAQSALSPEESKQLSKSGREWAAKLDSAPDRTTLVAEAANATSEKKLTPKDRELLEELLIRKLKAQEPVPEPARPTEPSAGGDTGAPQVTEQPSIEGQLKVAVEPVSEPLPETPARANEVVTGERIPGAEGREATVKFADSGEMGVRYRVGELDDLQASHNPETFQLNPKAVEGTQHRRYESDKPAQEQVASHGDNPDSDILLDATMRPTEGPPGAREDGQVVFGHGRTMALKRAYARGKAEGYKADLLKRAQEFGIDPAEIEGKRQPVLFREITGGEGIDTSTREGLASINARSDVSSTKAKDALSDAATRAGTLRNAPKSLAHLEKTLEGEQTVRDYLGDPDGRAFVERLIEEGVISKQEASRFIDSAGVPTAEGREVIERTLEIAAIGDPETVANASPAMRAKLTRAIPAIIRTNNVEGFKISVALRKGLDLVSEARANGMTVRDLITQDSFFEPRADSPYAVAMANLLENSTPKEVAAAFRAFAKDAEQFAAGVGDDLFGEPLRDAAQSFAKHIGQPEFGKKVSTGATNAFLDEPKLMHTAGLPAVVIEAAKLAATVERTPLIEIGKRLTQRATRWLEGLGTDGKIIAQGIDAVDIRAATRAAKDQHEIAVLLRSVPDGYAEQAMKVLNGRVLEVEAPAAVVRIANRVREILDGEMQNANAVGFRRMVRGKKVELRGSGKAYPEAPNAAGRKLLDEAKANGLASPRVAAQATAMVKRGEAVDMQDALDMLLRYREAGLRGRNLYFESTRVQLPDDMIEWNPRKTLPGAIERNWLFIEALREWGPTLQKLNFAIGRMANENDPAVGVVTSRFIQRKLGVGGLVPQPDQTVAGAIANYETLVRLGYSVLSPIRNMGQRFTNTSHLSLGAQAQAFVEYPPFLNVWMKSARKLEEEIIQTGAVRASSELAQLENQAPLHHAAALALKAFTTVERGNQVYAALVARHSLERNMRMLAALQDQVTTTVGQSGETTITQGTRGSLRRMIDVMMNLSLDPAGAAARSTGKMLNMTDDEVRKLITSGERLSPEQFEAAMHRVVRDTQFPITLATERAWWALNPSMRLLAKFKVFGIEQVGYLYQHVAKEAVKGNVAPLVKFIGFTMLAGEIYNVARDGITGSEQSATAAAVQGKPPREVAARVLQDFVDGGGVGMLYDLTYGIGSWLGGPLYSTAKNLSSAAVDIARRPEQAGTALMKFAERELSVSKQITPQIRRVQKMFGDAGGTYFEYNRWRSRAFKYEKEKPTGDRQGRAQDAVVQAIEGRKQFGSSSRTLSYTYAARAVTAGDTAAARTYLERVLGDARNRQELGDIESAVRRSMNSQSPLGPISEDDEQDFLKQYQPEERREAKRTQEAWIRLYERALSSAVRSTKSRLSNPQAR